MHIPDGFLTPGVAAFTAVVSTAALAPAVILTQRRWGDAAPPRLGVLAAFVFAAQMVNFTIPGATSGHLLGTTLLTLTLGPWAAIVVMAAVLIVQALLFADGGITALGANLWNMALVGAATTALIAPGVRAVLRGPAATIVAGVVAAWCSVVAAAISCSVMLAASGGFDLSLVLNAMLLPHIFIGLGEAAITGVTLACLASLAPELLADGQSSPQLPGPSLAARIRHLHIAGLTVALIVGVFISPWASPYDDGLEAAVAALRQTAHLAIEPTDPPLWGYAVMPDYDWPDTDTHTSTETDPRPLAWMATSIAGALGTLATAALAYGMARGVAGRKPGVSTPET